MQRTLYDSSSGITFSKKCVHILLEEPRAGLRPVKRCNDGKLMTRAVRLNNNILTDVQDFQESMEKLLSQPHQLSWIDLSFNDLTTIDRVLTTYHQLSVLNLHGNSIRELSEVDKLASLPNLKSLTLHGNPIESESGYRSYILSVLPQLRSLDFSGVTKQDRVKADVWTRMNAKAKRGRRTKEE
uniref:Leucine-rich repeat-containing protein 51 n=1 Tax=Leptobrachium leishanense TaxID=445787 RepID=A0A8C5QMK0_9ANUR